MTAITASGRLRDVLNRLQDPASTGHVGRRPRRHAEESLQQLFARRLSFRRARVFCFMALSLTAFSAAPGSKTRAENRVSCRLPRGTCRSSPWQTDNPSLRGRHARSSPPPRAFCSRGGGPDNTKIVIREMLIGASGRRMCTSMHCRVRRLADHTFRRWDCRGPANRSEQPGSPQRSLWSQAFGSNCERWRRSPSLLRLYIVEAVMVSTAGVAACLGGGRGLRDGCAGGGRRLGSTVAMMCPAAGNSATSAT